MRKITTQAVNAFLSEKEYSLGNTKVFYDRYYNGVTTLSLHGNNIARIVDGKIEITNAGWNTNTTKERLNGIPGVSIQQKAGVWYLNGNAWDGKWITISK